MTRIIALDVGTKSCGLAKTDELGLTVQAVGTVQFKGLHETTPAFLWLIEHLVALKPKVIVVGLPHKEDGTKDPQAKKVEQFISHFRKFLKARNHSDDQYQWQYFDERYSTHAADQFMLSQNVSRSKRAKHKDTMAAVMILREYLGL